MRRIAAHIEGLAAAPFMLLVGLIGGALQGIPHLLLGGTGGAGLRATQLVVIGIATVLGWTAALLLWWIAVRRRGWSVRMTATHVTLGLGIAYVLATGLGMVATSIATDGVFAEALLRNPLAVAIPNLVLIVIRVPLWFLGAVIAVALGRKLMGGEQTIAASRSIATPPEAVT